MPTIAASTTLGIDLAALPLGPVTVLPGVTVATAGDALYAATGGGFVIDNQGVIDAGGAGIRLAGAGTIGNAGTIAGGIHLPAGGMLTNIGLIADSGTSDNGVVLAGATLVNHGRVTAPMVLGDGAALVTDGTVEGAVTLAGHAELVLAPGGTLAGPIFDTTVTASGTPALPSGWALDQGTLTIESGFLPMLFILQDALIAGALRISGGGAVSVACFAEGTPIATARGLVAVEDLAIGSAVLSAFGGTAPVVWTGRRRLIPALLENPAGAHPVLLRAGAIADAVPDRDLYLSPDHALFIDGWLVPAICLVNGESIRQVRVREVTYWHVELPQHDVLLAANAPCESYLDMHNRGAFDTPPPAHALERPVGLDPWGTLACAPQCREGATLAAIHGRIASRARSIAARASPA